VRISVVLAQLPISWDIPANLAAIGEVLAQTRPGDVVVLPEGALSGYAADLSPLDTLDRPALAAGIETLAGQARDRSVHVFCGSLLPSDGNWHNAALHFGPHGERHVYRKINLAMNERDRLLPGDELPVLDAGGFTAGVQLCREIRFPEQWQHLARAGAHAFVYLTNAANPGEPAGVWRSHLISRAAENQRFLFAANVADPAQHCPTMAVSPRGEVLAELPPGDAGVLRVTADLDEISDWYLTQQRRDVVSVDYHPPRWTLFPAGRGISRS
jgi:predicted amidohydrolase